MSVRVTARMRLKAPTHTVKARSPTAARRRATRPPGSLRPPAVNDAVVIRSRAISLRDDRFAAVSRERVVEATGRETDVREHSEERNVVDVDAVAELVVRRDVRRRGEGCATRDGLERDVDDVVTEAPAVREALVVAAEHAHAVRRGGHGSRHVETELFRRLHEERLVQAGDAGEEDRDEIVARRGRDSDAVDRVEKAGGLRVGDPAEELPVAARLRAVPEVLRPDGDDDLVHERRAE